MTSTKNSLGHILMGEQIHLFAPKKRLDSIQFPSPHDRFPGVSFERAKKTHNQEIPQPRIARLALIFIAFSPVISNVARSCFKFQQTEK